MLGIIFNPYPDEVALSWFIRYHIYSGNIRWRHTSIDLFGKCAHNLNILYAHNLGFFCNQIPNELEITPDYIINKMTIFPLFKPFMPIERANTVKKGMADGGLGSIHAKIRPNSGQIFLKEGRVIKVCKACLKNDEKDYGEAYLHRIHQVPGNFLCIKHNTPLNYFQNDKANHEIDMGSLFELELQSYKIKPNLAQYYLYLGQDIEFVLSGGLSNFSLDLVSQRYRQRLQEKGYVLMGRIKQRDLISDFKQFYPIDFLEDLESNVDYEDDNSWFRQMIAETKISIHPIRHLLFIRFLFGSIKEFLKYCWVYKPFGDSPYPCLNPVADHYKKDVIQSCELKRTYTIADPVGVFKCDCGFVYARRGPDKIENDRLRGKVKQYGYIWEDKLKELVNNSSDVSYIAKEMKCCSETVIRYATLFGIIDKLNTDQRIMSKKIKKIISDTELEVFKEQITQYIIKNPDHSRVQIKTVLYKQYFLLYRRDKQWLEGILPQPYKNRAVLRNCEYIDWELKDEKILQMVKKIVSAIFLEEKPRRITRNLIAEKSNTYRLPPKNRISNFPRTEEYLLSCCETVEDFRNRKIK